MSTIKIRRLCIHPKHWRPPTRLQNKVTQPSRPAPVSFSAAVRTPELILVYLQTVALFTYLNCLQHASEYISQGNGPIWHVETCPDFFFNCKSTHNKIHCQNSSC
jgi:hypothetical protein